MPQWTEDQQKVIGSPAGRIICSAAAGSGKTAVMIERIVRLIREGADPFSFLVITFTNAAAAEMKEKIRKRLLEERRNPVIALAAEKAVSMEVCTIHSFCQHLIRQEFQVVGVDPAFRICSAAQREKLFSDAFRKACNELKKNGDADYLSFTRRYEPAAAREIVGTVYPFIMSLPDPLGWLAEKTENIPLHGEKDHPWYRTAAKMVKEKLLMVQVILRRQAEMFDEYEKVEDYRKVFIADQQIVEGLKAWSEGGTGISENFEFMRAPSLKNLNDLEIDWKDRYQNLRNDLKERCGELRSLIFTDGERESREFAGIRESLRGLRKLTEELHRQFENNKARFRVLDFSDLEHKALAILKDEGVRKSVQGRYRQIFVDECQDVSAIQDALIGALAGKENTLFMVGDVKQSIYRFRMANPDLFLRRLTGGTEGTEVHYLRENFRSRPEILETANMIFRDVMRKEAAGLDYTPMDELRPGRTNCAGSVPAEVDLLEPAEEKTRLEAVADHVAGRIRAMKEEGPWQYRDMMILMPEVSTDGPVLEELLKERNIPVFFDGKGDFFQLPEVEWFRNLLSLLDHPHQDVPLLSVLVNPPFDFSEEELSSIRIGCGGKAFWEAFLAEADRKTPLGRKCRAAAERIDAWRFRAEHLRLDELIWYLMEDSSLYAVVGAWEHGLAAQKNLRNIGMQAVRAYEQGCGTLREFLDQLSEQAAGGDMQAAPTLGSADNVVRIMTIHKSKGLQFPVVFCLGMEKGLTGKPAGPVSLDAELGVCLRYKVPEWRLSRKSAADRIFEWKAERDRKAEKICLLYVAVTRAQEKLVIVGTETDRSLWHLPEGDHRVLAASDYLDWIMPSLLDDKKKSTTCTQGAKPYKISILEDNQQNAVETGKVIHSLAPWVEIMLSAPPVEGLWKDLYPEKETGRTEEGMKKYSVTALLQEARNRIFMEEEEQTPEEKRTPEDVRRAMNRWGTASRPAFLEPEKEPGGAARGTVVHRFLSLADLEEIRNQSGGDADLYREQIRRMVREGVFTPKEAGWINPEKIRRFFASSLGKRMLASPEVRREWDFNLYLPERGMILQGMIDCAFREGDGWILLDYKTDRIEDEAEFMEEYRPQLEWYAVALRRLTGKPVKESWLYALSVDKACALDGTGKAG